MDYLFEFTAHIDENKRPKDENFPKVVHVIEQYGGIESDEQVQDLYNKRVKALVMNPGIVVFLHENELIQSSLTFHQRYFIPWHMITHFHGRVKLMTPAEQLKTSLDSLIPSNPEPTEKDKKAVPN